MSSSDFESARDALIYEEISPTETFESRTDNSAPLTHRYKELDSLKNYQDLAKGLMNQQMKDWLQKYGYRPVESGSSEEKRLLGGVNGSLINAVEGVTNNRLTAKGLEIGTPVIVERNDSVDPRRKLNVVFGFAEVMGEGRSDKGKFYILYHPVNVNPDLSADVARQTRTDDNRFAPAIWMEFTDAFFGRRGPMPTVISYPLEEKK